MIVPMIECTFMFTVNGFVHNKVGYMATLVACGGGQGPYLRLLHHLGRRSKVRPQKPKKMDRPKDGPTDGWMYTEQSR